MAAIFRLGTEMIVFFAGFVVGVVCSVLAVALFVLYPPEGKQLENAGNRQRRLDSQGN
jgi:hypothetical protein